MSTTSKTIDIVLLMIGPTVRLTIITIKFLKQKRNRPAKNKASKHAK